MLGRQRERWGVGFKCGGDREKKLQCWGDREKQIFNARLQNGGGGAFKCGGDRDREKRIFGCGGHTEREKNFQCWVVKRGSRVSGVGERENNLLTLIIRVGRQRKLRFKLTTYM